MAWAALCLNSTTLCLSQHNVQSHFVQVSHSVYLFLLHHPATSMHHTVNSHGPKAPHTTWWSGVEQSQCKILLLQIVKHIMAAFPWRFFTKKEISKKLTTYNCNLLGFPLNDIYAYKSVNVKKCFVISASLQCKTFFLLLKSFFFKMKEFLSPILYCVFIFCAILGIKMHLMWACLLSKT